MTTATAPDALLRASAAGPTGPTGAAGPHAAGSRRAGALLVTAVLVAVSQAGCSDGDAGTAGPTTSPSASPSTSAPAIAVTSPAGDLRSDLVHLLQEHVFLTGAALSLAVSEAPDAPSTAAAAAALDRNTLALTALVEDHYGADASARFLLVWRAHIDRYVDFTVALAAGDRSDADAAIEALEAFEDELAGLLAGFTQGVMTAETLAPLVAGQVGAVLAVAQAAVGERADGPAVLHQAAQASRPLAVEVAQGVARHLELEGDVDGPAARLRGELTALQQAHVYLTGAAWRAVAVESGAEVTTAAMAAVESNAAALGHAVDSVWGEAAAGRFTELWLEQARALVDAARQPGEAAPPSSPDSRDSPDSADPAVRLAGVNARIARLVSEHTGQALAVAEIEKVIDAQGSDLLAAARLAGEPGARPELYQGAQLAPELAVLLVAGIAEHDPRSLA